MPPKIPLPAHDDIAPSESEEIVADGVTDPAKPKRTKTAVDRRSSPRQAATTRKTKASAPTETTETAQISKTVEADDEPVVDDEVEADARDVPNGVDPEDQGSAAVASPTIPRFATAKIAATDSPALVTPSEPSVRTSMHEAKKKKGFGRRLLRFLGLVVVLGGLAVAAYLIWPTINSRYIQPVENTAADLSTVQDQLGEIDSRLDSVVAELAINEARLSETESGQGLFAERLDELAAQIEQQTTRIENLDELAATLSSDQEAANSSAAQQLQVTRAAERMSRARLFLYQANYGLAASDLQAARQTLAAIGTESGDEYSEVIDRLDRAIANLPEFPVSAAGDLDIAWGTLLGPRSSEVSFDAGTEGDTNSPDVVPDPDPDPDSDPASNDGGDPTP